MYLIEFVVIVKKLQKQINRPSTKSVGLFIQDLRNDFI